LGVSRGYLRRDELTQTKFVANPYRPEERIYRSGDLARLLPNGEIAYLGRIDDQVQIRGFRVELGEVESVLLHHPAVREAVVVAFPEDQSMRLVAYCVPQPGSENERFPTAAELREFLKSELPDYMVPATFLQLDCFPLTSNGKVDRRALPSPDGRQFDTGACYVAPRNDSERVLAGIWQQVLKLDRVGAHDNFFDLGGDSLQLIRVKNQIREELAVDLPVVELFRYPTVDSLSRFLSENQTRGAELEQSEQRAQQRKAALQRRRTQRQGGARE
jgi:acyl carrier protein